jgi:hypothetical protein
MLPQTANPARAALNPSAAVEFLLCKLMVRAGRVA